MLPMSLAKMPGKSSNPINVCLFGTYAVVLDPNPRPDLIQYRGSEAEATEDGFPGIFWLH
jgi:hypothetical protein